MWEKLNERERKRGKSFVLAGFDNSLDDTIKMMIFFL